MSLTQILSTPLGSKSFIRLGAVPFPGTVVRGRNACLRRAASSFSRIRRATRFSPHFDPILAQRLPHSWTAVTTFIVCKDSPYLLHQFGLLSLPLTGLCLLPFIVPTA